MSILSKLFGDANQKIINQLQKKVDEINQLEKKFENFKLDDFKKKTEEFKKKLNPLGAGLKPAPNDFAPLKDDIEKKLNEILPEAFALVREAAKRTLSQRHFDVQLIAGMVLHQGNLARRSPAGLRDGGGIAEMKTGEGKTLAATAAVYLNALTGRGVHIITVNDYLARRDTVWMGQIYSLLGLSVGCLNHESAYLYSPRLLMVSSLRDKTASEDTSSKRGEGKLDEERDKIGSYKVVDEFLRPVERKEAYTADITYGTNNEFGFDYLRDNMVQGLDQKVQRELYFAIVDEVDSILIDEARTPLIISAPSMQATDKYRQFAQLVSRLKENDPSASSGQGDYNIDEKMKAATLTEEGIKKMENWLGVENIYTDRGIRDVHHIEQALKARVLFKKDRDYVVKDGEIIIVDEFTGRLMFGRRYSDGLHQAIEAKEGVEIKQESVTMATITFQNYFRMYEKLAGMTGTAATEAEEFSKIYNLDVIIIPTNKPMIRQDKSDVIFKTQKEKYNAIVKEIKERNKKGQPILVGTISIENNEYLSDLLDREGIEHKVLNAKHHEKEAEIIAQAGRRGSVTIATNMAGRGVDVVLSGNPPDKKEQQKVLELGGLHVLGTERHEARRIDNQLRGRSGRQGDPGSSQFFVSMEDDLMRIFGGDRMKNMMQALGLPDNMPIENKMISKQIETAQKKVEGHNFDIRKHLVEYDDVINAHREVVYRTRNEVLMTEVDSISLTRKDADKRGKNNCSKILNFIKDEIENVVKFHTQSEDENSWNLDEIYEVMDTIFPVPLQVRIELEEIKEKRQETRNNNQKITNNQTSKSKIIEYLYNLAVGKYSELEDKINSDENIKKQMPDIKQPMTLIEKSILLRSIDTLWVEHIDAMDQMRQGIGLRGYGQKDPLVEYKKEAHRMFTELFANIRKQVVYTIFKIGLTDVETPRRGVSTNAENMNFSSPAKQGVISSTIKQGIQTSKKKIGRNDPCPCGATKSDGKPVKYKHCHGR